MKPTTEDSTDPSTLTSVTRCAAMTTLRWNITGTAWRDGGGVHAPDVICLEILCVFNFRREEPANRLIDTFLSKLRYLSINIDSTINGRGRECARVERPNEAPQKLFIHDESAFWWKSVCLAFGKQFLLLSAGTLQALIRVKIRETPDPSVFSSRLLFVG